MEPLSIFKALADPTRQRILGLLLEHTRCVRALAGELAVSEAAVSQQLGILRRAGLVRGRRSGRFMHYEVERGALREAARALEALADTPPAPCACRGGCCKHGRDAHERP